MLLTYTTYRHLIKMVIQKRIKNDKETKILDEEIVTATCVRVPVITGHLESTNIEFDNLMILKI